MYNNSYDDFNFLLNFSGNFHYFYGFFPGVEVTRCTMKMVIPFKVLLHLRMYCIDTEALVFMFNLGNGFWGHF